MTFSVTIGLVGTIRSATTDSVSGAISIAATAFIGSRVRVWAFSVRSRRRRSSFVWDRRRGLRRHRGLHRRGWGRCPHAAGARCRNGVVLLAAAGWAVRVAVAGDNALSVEESLDAN